MTYTITPLPTPPQRTDTEAVFASRGDALMNALPQFVTDANALSADATVQSSTATTQATIATVAATNAAASATAAGANASASAWINGNTYSQNQAAISQIDFITYRKKTASSTTTIDPANDPTNWVSTVPKPLTPTTSSGITTSATDVVLTNTSSGLQRITMTAIGKSVVLPDATTMQSVGGQVFVIRNVGGNPFGIRDNSGTLLTAVCAEGIAYVTLDDKSTSSGIWGIIGDKLEPGLLTLDSTFSSTYNPTVCQQFVALDNNTSIHFVMLATGAGFAAVVVDNVGKVISTPVTVSTTTNETPAIAYKIDATHAILFYGTGTTTHKVVVLTLIGSSPTYSITVGTFASLSATMYATSTAGWGGEDFIGAPKIAQLSSTLYLHSYPTSTPGTYAVAISVSGTTCTIGTPVIVPTYSPVANALSTTTYALTSTTGLVLYKAASSSGVVAVAISVSGTTCTIGTPVAVSSASSSSSPPSSVLVSSTKCIVIDDNNTSNVYAYSIAIAGTTITLGGPYTVEAIAGTIAYTGSNAARYNPHLWVLSTGSTNTIGLWYLSASSLSRAVVLSETSGTISIGTKVYGSICTSSLNTNGFGAIMPQGISEFIAIRQSLATTAGNGLQIQPSSIYGSTVTQGASISLSETMPQSPSQFNFGKLSSSDYILLPSGISSNIASPRISIMRSNGNAINNRGSIGIPEMYVANASGNPIPLANVSANRIVLLGVAIASSVSTLVSPLRLLNIEIAQ